MTKRLLMTVVLACLMVIPGVWPAIAGGSWLEGRDDLEPGESVTFSGDVSPGQLGWVEDGPFYAYLRVDAITDKNTAVWPFVLETDLPLGALVIDDRGPNRFAGVSITFDVPTGLGPGTYDLVYCNDPCTEGFGDLIGGLVHVGVKACGEDCDDEVTPAVGGGRRGLTASSVAPLSDELLQELREHSGLLAQLQFGGVQRLNESSVVLVTRRDEDPISPWVLAAVALGVTAATTVTVVAVGRRRASAT